MRVFCFQYEEIYLGSHEKVLADATHARACESRAALKGIRPQPASERHGDNIADTGEILEVA